MIEDDIDTESPIKARDVFFWWEAQRLEDGSDILWPYFCCVLPLELLWLLDMIPARRPGSGNGIASRSAPAG